MPIANDPAAAAKAASDEFILPILDQTPQSIVIFDGAGRRMVNTDLKDVGRKSLFSATFHTRFKSAEPP